MRRRQRTMLFSSLTWPTTSQHIYTRNEHGTHVLRHPSTPLRFPDASLIEMSSLGLWVRSSSHRLCFDVLLHVNVTGCAKFGTRKFNFPLHTQRVDCHITQALDEKTLYHIDRRTDSTTTSTQIFREFPGPQSYCTCTLVAAPHTFV